MYIYKEKVSNIFPLFKSTAIIDTLRFSANGYVSKKISVEKYIDTINVVLFQENKKPVIRLKDIIDTIYFRFPDSNIFFEIYAYDRNLKKDSLSIVYDIPDSATIDKSTEQYPFGEEHYFIRWTPEYSDTGFHELTFIVNDDRTPNLSDTTSVVISVIGNMKPIFEPMEDQIVNEYEQLKFSVSANDSDGDSLSYSCLNLPEGALLDSNLFSWTPIYNHDGDYVLQFVATDDGLPEFSDTLEVNVSVVDNDSLYIKLIRSTNSIIRDTMHTYSPHITFTPTASLFDALFLVDGDTVLSGETSDTILIFKDTVINITLVHETGQIEKQITIINVMFEDDFSYGSIDSSWIITNPNKSYDIENYMDFLRIRQTKSASSDGHINLPLDTITPSRISFRLNVAPINNETFFNVYGVGGSTNDIVNIRIYDKLYIENSSFNISFNTWYRYDIYFDWQNQTYDVHLNDNSLGTFHFNLGPTSATSLRLRDSRFILNGIIAFDDLRIFY
jgi:hypothetical protein